MRGKQEAEQAAETQGSALSLMEPLTSPQFAVSLEPHLSVPESHLHCPLSLATPLGVTSLS